MTDDARNGPLKTPEPPDQEAVSHDEGDGPFGADMTNLRGGTRSENDVPEANASPYSTGTSSATGRSLARDPRSTFDGQTTGTSNEREEQDESHS
ncbi:hypothetical protein [Deinococcus peraridilitoris]|uniref:Uncharacterized protein n=1 Tax=Deinococcus peraridilitoris (strain DSM 19664 / LMG 22246 / CIP 109416 / KR-200) TaxID=937777 RepID=L0A2I3_DEIPD|nr:hypothetical protein [Deinococcus peraridilitoris]AFZ68088.1 hypothetical protein Deipe_2623 [Deinococcus peraridilitoris DSM 19664]